MTAPDCLLDFGDLLRGLYAASGPCDRVARHLLLLDAGETYRFALRHPDSLTKAAPE